MAGSYTDQMNDFVKQGYEACYDQFSDDYGAMMQCWEEFKNEIKKYQNSQLESDDLSDYATKRKNGTIGVRITKSKGEQDKENLNALLAQIQTNVDKRIQEIEEGIYNNGGNVDIKYLTGQDMLNALTIKKNEKVFRYYTGNTTNYHGVYYKNCRLGYTYDSAGFLGFYDAYEADFDKNQPNVWLYKNVFDTIYGHPYEEWYYTNKYPTITCRNSDGSITDVKLILGTEKVHYSSGWRVYNSRLIGIAVIEYK